NHQVNHHLSIIIALSPSPDRPSVATAARCRRAASEGEFDLADSLAVAAAAAQASRWSSGGRCERRPGRAGRVRVSRIRSRRQRSKSAVRQSASGRRRWRCRTSGWTCWTARRDCARRWPPPMTKAASAAAARVAGLLQAVLSCLGLRLPGRSWSGSPLTAAGVQQVLVHRLADLLGGELAQILAARTPSLAAFAALRAGLQQRHCRSRYQQPRPSRQLQAVQRLRQGRLLGRESPQLPRPA
uniref:Secreted protein n=1 Tax=Macrostomum lignano TaxID=282301 RepID=A0A1I8FCF8_9PLAT